MSAATKSLPAAAHSAPLIFIVDDEPVSAEIVAELLQLAGYRTRVFNDSRLAADELSRSSVKPDVLLADFKMPGLNGLQLLARGKSEIRGLKTVLMSGLAADAALGEKGFTPDQWVTKPFPVTTLLKSVRTALASTG
ncbi:MAG: response regulator [Limisphaerales bacterium]